MNQNKVRDYITLFPRTSPLTPDELSENTRQMRELANRFPVRFAMPKFPQQGWLTGRIQHHADNAVLEMFTHTPEKNEPEGSFLSMIRGKVRTSSSIKRGELFFNPNFSFKDTINSIIEPNPHVPGPRTVAFQKKVRNACISGHFAGDEKYCKHCQRARFYTLVSGYHADMPYSHEVAAYLKYRPSEPNQQLVDYRFVLKYLGLPEQPTPEQIDAFIKRLNGIFMLVQLSGRNQGSQIIVHPLSHELVTLPALSAGKSNFMGHIVMGDPMLRDIYANAAFMWGDLEAPIDTSYLDSLYKGLEPSERPGGKTEYAKRIAKELEAKGVKVHVIDSLSEINKPVMAVDPGTDPMGMVIMDESHMSVTPSSSRPRRRSTLSSAIAAAMVSSFKGAAPIVGDIHSSKPQGVTVNDAAAEKPRASLLVRALIQRHKS